MNSFMIFMGYSSHVFVPIKTHGLVGLVVKFKGVKFNKF